MAELAERALQVEVAVARVHRRDSLLSAILHDLRGALGALSMPLELVEDRLIQRGIVDLAQGWFPGMRKTAGKMDRLMTDLGDLIRIESGRIALASKHGRPADLVALALRTSQATARGVRLRVEVDQTDAGIEIEERLVGAVSDLVNNMIKHASTGEVSIRAHRTATGVCLRISRPTVDDRDHDVENVFERFWQGQMADHLDAGMSLSLAKAVVGLHRGKLWAERTPDGQTAFCVSLPIAG